MKHFAFKIATPILALIICMFLPSTQTLAQDFQRIYGTSFDNTFSKAIKDGSNYYVLGQDEPTSGATPHATVTRLDANGLHQWTLRLNIPSMWNDAVLTPTGDLLVVGATLPFDATNKSLIGLVTPSAGGNFTWVRTYDVTGRESNAHIVRSPNPDNPLFPYYIVGSQFDFNGGPTWDDIILLNINESGTFNWKKRFAGTDDDEFGRNLDVMANGDLILSGNLGTQGVILITDNTGALISGATPAGLSFSFADVTPSSGGGFYAVGGTFPAFTAYLSKYDTDLITLWDATIAGMTSVSQVWDDPANGDIYVTGTGVFNSLSRSVVLRIVEVANVPILQWVKFLDNGETSYTGGSTTFLSPNQIAFVDGRAPLSGGFGQVCAFMSVSDLGIETCMTIEDFADIETVSLTYDGPSIPPIDFFDFPTGTDELSAAVNWEQEAVCNDTCQASFIITPIGDCGHIQVTNTSAGVQPLTYSWCNGSTSEDLDVMLPCGPHTFCLTITDANGCSSSMTQTITVTDNIPPVAVCVPAFGVVLDANCQFIVTPPMIDGGSFDNCQIQSLSTSPAILNGCGVFPVTLTVTDWCGNTNTCTTMIQTIEDVPPVITCPADMVISTAFPDCDIVVNGLQWVTLSDNCSLPTVNYLITGATNDSGTGDASGLVFNEGISTITYIATDDCGNTAECSFLVTVVCDCNCIGNLVQNPGFFEGATVGNLGNPATSTHWARSNASPQIVASDSCCDAYSVQMFGEGNGGESIKQSINFIQGHQYKISFCARYVNVVPTSPGIRFGFSASNMIGGFPYGCVACEQIGSTPVITNQSWTNYTLPIWTPTQNWNRLDIRAFTGSTIAWGRIDNICIQEVTYACCEDEQAFIENAGNAINLYVDETGEEAIFEIGNLPECDSVAFIDWGDGNITAGPFGSQTVRRHKFLDHLLARIQYQVSEYDQEASPDQECLQHLFMDSLDIIGLDSCICNAFSDLLIRNATGNTSEPIYCGEPAFVVPCPNTGSGSFFTGKFQCIGEVCSDNVVHWTLTGPGGSYSGTSMANPYFGINILPAYIQQPGLYTLVLEGNCENQNCLCEIQFMVDCPGLCPCTTADITEFATRVQRGFAQTQQDNSCTVCFSPVALNDCETVEWHLNSTDEPPVGTSTGRQSFCYAFPDAGTYNVIMNVSKKKDDGSNCDKQKREQRVTSCASFSNCVDPLMDNPGFNLGVQPGGLNSGGMSRGWKAAAGEPEIIEGEPGSLDGWSVLLSGNLDRADVLSRLDPVCLEKTTGRISLQYEGIAVNDSGVQIAVSDSGVQIFVRLYLGDIFNINECDPLNCYSLASVSLPRHTTDEWYELQIPYDLSDWAALSDCGGSAVVLVRPAIYIGNAFGSNQGGEDTYSFMQLDQFCMSETIVSTDDPLRKENIRLYPNPTNGTLTVELSTPASSGMRLQIINLTGQILSDKKAETGSNIQSLETSDLSEGMYLLQVISGGRMVSIEKFVKQ